MERSTLDLRLQAVGVAKSAATCGLITSVGDVLAQAVTRGQGQASDFAATDLSRAARMGGYG